MKKWLQDNLMSSLTLMGIIGAILYFSEIKQLLFSSPNLKYKTENHVIEGPTPKQEVQAIYLDSIENVHAMRSRKKRDSLIVEILNAQRHQDSINMLNAVQMSEMSKHQKEQDTLLKQYISIHDQ